MSAKIKIAFSGAHGTGKTTALNIIQERLMESYPHLVISRLPEIARKCPWPVNQKSCADGQAWIFHTHIAHELATAKDADVLLCDRTAIDNLIYAYCALGSGRVDVDWLHKAMILADKHILPTYNLIYFFKPTFDLVSDGFRDADKKFQASVHKAFIDFIECYQKKEIFKPWPGLAEAYDHVVNLVSIELCPKE